MPLVIALMAVLTLVCGSVTVGLTVRQHRSMATEQREAETKFYRVLEGRDAEVMELHKLVGDQLEAIARKQLEFDTLKALARRLTEKTMATAPAESHAEAVRTMWGYYADAPAPQRAQHASQATDAP